MPIQERVTVNIMHDDNPMSPREWDNLGHFIGWTSGAGFNAEFVGDDDQRDHARVMGVLHTPSRDNLIHKFLRELSHPVVVLVQSPDQDRYFLEGAMYATREDLIREYGDLWKKRLEDAQRILKGEANTWYNWASGNVFGYEVIKEHKCPECDQWHMPPDGLVDSCWGFIAENEADLLEQLKDHFTADTPEAEAMTLALTDGWTGDYPKAGTATVEIKEATSATAN